MFAAPATLEEVQGLVRAAREKGGALAPSGGGVLAHIGYPGSVDAAPISATALNKIVEYVPGDMVVVAQAGVTVASLQSALAEHGQWLPLEPAFPDRQTVGGITAARAPSLVRAGYGSVRDWLIGVEVVGGDGQVIRGGGKVVKNVSGYDLPKLYCGSYGTLGILTEVAFKAAPRPEESRVLLAVLPDDRNSEGAVDALLASTSPAYVYLLNRIAARSILGGDAADAQYLAVRYDGMREAAAELQSRAEQALAATAISVLALPDPIASPLSQALRDFAAVDAPLLVRFNILSSQAGAFARMLEWTAAKAGFEAQVIAECRAGSVLARFVPAVADASWEAFYPAFRDKAERVGGNFVIERMPREWRALDAPVWYPLLGELELMRGIKQALDPGNIFNPGRFVGGI